VAEPPEREEESAAAARARAGDGARGAKSDGHHGLHATHHGPPRGVVREYAESLVVTAIMALFGMTFIVQAVKVPTGSMQNTILIGDHLLVNKFIFAPGPVLPFLPQREIQRFDIIVFKYPGKFPTGQFLKHTEVDDTAPNNTPYKTNYVKRVIGLPGERVEVRGTQVLVNGQPLEEHRIAADNPPDTDDPATPGNDSLAPLTLADDAPATPADSAEARHAVYWRPESLKGARRLTGEETQFDVPEGHYLVMGDNRENSQDSRFWGFVPRDVIVGRAMFVYWSYDESAPSSGNFIVDFFRNTRWGRTGTFVK
jgi:signal peptidase I